MLKDNQDITNMFKKDETVIEEKGEGEGLQFSRHQVQLVSLISMKNIMFLSISVIYLFKLSHFRYKLRKKQ
jgi:hypothetical protein